MLNLMLNLMPNLMPNLMLQATQNTPSGVLVRCMCGGLAGGLPLVARAALLACVGGLAFIMCVCLWWFPALLRACLDLPNHCVSL